MAIIVPIIQGRLVQPQLVINGQDILLGLAAQNLEKFAYTDSTSDKADDLSVEVADPDRVWMTRFLPSALKGTLVQANLLVSNWDFPGDTRLFKCGSFFITDVDFKGPPNSVTIKCSSIPPNGAKNEKRHKSWEQSDLKSIAGQIAQQNKLTLYYDTQQNPKVKRTDQVDKSDLEYLRDRVKEAGLSLKIHNQQLVIYSEEEYEQRDPAFTLIYGATHILEYEFHSRADDTYASAQNSYVNPETGKLTQTEFTPEEPPEGSQAKLRTNEDIEYDPDDDRFYTEDMPGGQAVQILVAAPRAADYDYSNDAPEANKGKGKGGKKNSTRKNKKKLRDKNKKEKQCQFTVLGNIEYLSGICCTTQGFGIFDTKWFVDNSTHDVDSNGYTTKLTMRKTLKGY
jgi:phage protein D